MIGLHGRRIRIGQVWRSNDPRRFAGIRVVGFEGQNVHAENIVTKRPTTIALTSFTVGTRGWSLEQEATS